MKLKSILAKPFANYISRQTKKNMVHAVKDQQTIFENLVKQAANTDFGKEHGFNEIKTFIIKTEDFECEYNVKEWEEIEFPYKEYTSFIVIYEEKEYDFTNIVNKIKHNIFTKKQYDSI